MAISSIEIKNLLSFDHLVIRDIKDINCIVGKNNVGKSNLLKLIKYFYLLLDGGRELPPELNSNYSSFGSITIEYDTTRIRKIVTSRSAENNTPYFKHIYQTLFGDGLSLFVIALMEERKSAYKLTLTINKDNSTKWSTKNVKILDVIKNLYPFFDIQTRHIDLYDWRKLWDLVSRLKSFHVDDLKSEDVIQFFNEKLSRGGNDYKDYVERIREITKTAEYNYSEKVLNYLKVGLEGHSFTNDGEMLKRQSDGSNSYLYIEWFLSLMISLTRRDYIEPTVYVDEPEVGLHPKLNEQLIKKIYDIYQSYKKTKSEIELGKYATPYPKIIISTHSPNIVKSTVKLFPGVHKVYHFSKGNGGTVIRDMVSHYSDPRFLNIFSDNEARLFFSEFILFVEGATEIELFRNVKLGNKFKNLELIDVYATNDVILGGINPEFSNAAIPYLVLYDADVLISFSCKYGSFNFSDKKINLGKIKKKNKYSYFGSKKHELNKNLEKLFDLSSSSVFSLSKSKACMEPSKPMDYGMPDVLDIINNHVLNYENKMILSTTVEGLLICESSIVLFVRWLRSVIVNDLYIKETTGNINVIISKKMKSVNLFVFEEVCAAMGSLLSPVFVEHEGVEQVNHDYIKKLKYTYLRHVRKEIIGAFSKYQKRDFISFMRLIFGGKTDTLVSLKIQRKAHLLDADYILDIEKNVAKLSPLDYLFGKTSGWVTEFLDFSIDEIEKLEGAGSWSEKNKIFARVFPELSDILKRLQPR